MRGNLVPLVASNILFYSFWNIYYEFCFNNQFDDDIDTQTLISTGFIVQEYPNDTVYIEDRDEKIIKLCEVGMMAPTKAAWVVTFTA